MGVVVFVIRARTRQRTARERFFYASKNERVYQLGAVVRMDFQGRKREPEEQLFERASRVFCGFVPNRSDQRVAAENVRQR